VGGAGEQGMISTCTRGQDDGNLNKQNPPPHAPGVRIMVS